MRSINPVHPGLFALLLAALLGACSDPETPEGRVRAFVAEMSASAEARSWLDFTDYISDRYRDDRGLDKDAAIAVITRYVLANQRIHVFERVKEVRIDGPARASAVVYAAIAGQPIAKVEDLARITADIYRFEIHLAEDTDGQLRVVRGDWKPARLEHFFVGG